VRSNADRISPTVSNPASRPFRCSSFSQAATFFSAEMTVEWLRPPKKRPVHRHHPGVRDRVGPALGLQGLGVQPEELADGLLHIAQGDGLGRVPDHVA